MAIQTTVEKQYGLPELQGRGETLIRARAKRNGVVKMIFAAIDQLPEERRPFFADLAGRLTAQTSAAWWVSPELIEMNRDATDWLRTAKEL